MEVQWIGTATMEVRNGNDVILIDPYNQPYNKRFKKISEEEMKGVKAIFITHPHLDHFTKIDQFSKQAGYCPIYVNAKGIETAKKHFKSPTLNAISVSSNWEEDIVQVYFLFKFKLGF